MPLWRIINLQDRFSPLMQHLLFFHDHVIFILTVVTILSLYLILSILLTNFYDSFLFEGQLIETLWTIIPSILLLMIAFPSLKALYLLEENLPSNFRIKIVGHQWFWSYESLSLREQNSFIDTRMNFRLLKNSSSPIILSSIIYRALISSEDVIHSWRISSLGLKVDALPGRINQLFIFSSMPGILTGQCSEICGANHSFIPIIMEVLKILERE